MSLERRLARVERSLRPASDGAGTCSHQPHRLVFEDPDAAAWWAAVPWASWTDTLREVPPGACGRPRAIHRVWYPDGWRDPAAEAWGYDEWTDVPGGSIVRRTIDIPGHPHQVAYRQARAQEAARWA
jgi:hypothetical protein